MEQLISKIKMNDSQVKSYIARAVAKNLSGLVEPCFYPALKKDFHNILKMTNLTENDLKEFTKRRWKGRKEEKLLAYQNHVTNFYIFLAQYFLNKRDKTTYKYIIIFYTIRVYAGFMHVAFSKYCNDDTFKYALDTITRTHLFSREKSIPNALYFIANGLIQRWTRGLRENDLDVVARFIQEARARVTQSMKSFANTYYKASEEGVGIKTEEEPSEEENSYQLKSSEKGVKLADEITKKITVYRYTDIKSQEAARQIAKVNASLATQIISKLNNTKYSDNLRIIYRLYVKDIPDAKSLCGSNYEAYVRKLMSIKRSNMKIYFKQQINVLLIHLLDELDYKDKYSKLTSQTQYLINLFLAYYLTLILKNSVC